MSAAQWKVGDLALVTNASGSTFVGVWTLAPGIDYFWQPLPGQPNANQLVDPPETARPLVVIDPEDADQVRRLRETLRAIPLGAYGVDDETTRLQAALREFANPKPPKPDEPQGLGAVVIDNAGLRWVRSERYSDYVWDMVGGVDGGYRWNQIDAVEVLSDGVQP